MNKKEFINGLFKENSTYSTERQAAIVANLLNTVSSDIYSESQRFIFELIQNADDASINTNNEIHFDFLSDKLIVSHNGKPFDENDILSIAGAGDSTKQNDPTKTGYKGIGFKSVFGKSEKVIIFSGGYQLRFDKSAHKTKLPWQIIPIWTELNELTKDIQKSLTLNKHNVSTIIEINNPKNLLNELLELVDSAQILLFLRRVSKISISSDGSTIFTIEKKITSQDTNYNEINLFKNNQKNSSWITKTFEGITIPPETKNELLLDDKTPEKLKTSNFTEISFAAKIDNGKLKGLEYNESLIFTYLPTKVYEFKFPFLINGSFLTNAAREGLHEDRIWNQWLFHLAADKLIDWLSLLAKSKFKDQILQLLPNKNQNIHNDLMVSFHKSLEQCINQKAFIPCSRTTKLKKASEVIVDETGLSELSFISTQTLVDFINKKQKAKFKPDSFISIRTKGADNLRSYNAMFFEVDALEDFFQSDVFKNNHKPSDNYALIEYFHDIAVKDESRVWNEKLKSIPFIFSKGKKLKCPKAVCFPTIDYKTDFGDGLSVIHTDVYSKIDNNSRIKNWLELLGVKEPSDEAYLENEIIGDIEKCITKSNYLKITRYIFNLHKKALLSEWHYDQLRDFKIYTTKKEFKPAKECYLSDFYEPALRLEKVNEAGSYVSPYYLEKEDLISEWKTFFIKIGISENISIIHFNTKITDNDGIEEEYFIQVSDDAKSGHKYPHLISRYNTIRISKIRFSEHAKEYSFSKIFWQQVFKTISPHQSEHAMMNWGYFFSVHYVKNYFYWCLENSKIYPSTTKKCLSARELFINDKEILEIAGMHLPVFDYPEPLPKEWKKIIPFKKKLELNDYLDILRKISLQKNKKYDEKNPKVTGKKNIELVYNKLTESLQNYSHEDKSEISNWAKVNKILSKNDEFENPSELYWIKGNSATLNSDLNTVFVPDELCNNIYLEELLTLFGVNIISEYKVITIDPTINDSLKNAIYSISPYLAAIIEKKEGESFNNYFHKLKNHIKKLKLIQAESIKLTVLHNKQQKVISMPDSHFDQNENVLYFTGNWKSPKTQYTLIDDLAKALQIDKYREELRLLLQLNPEEINEFLLSKFDVNVEDIEKLPAISEFLTKLTPPTEEDIIPSDTNILTDSTSIRTRISVNEEAQEIIFDTLKRNNFIVDSRYKITYTILEGIKNPDGKPIKVVVKSAKAGNIYFTPLEWLTLAEEDSQLFILTAGNIVRNVTINDLQKANLEFHMRFNTEQFVFSNLNKLASLFRNLPYTHFIFTAPDSTTDYLQQFGLSKRNKSLIDPSSDDTNLLL